jgi:SNF2 family DNA or RNA helicase
MKKLRIPQKYIADGSYLAQRAKIDIVDSSVNYFTIEMDMQMEKIISVINPISPNEVRGHCSCHIFKKDDLCLHIVAAIFTYRRNVKSKMIEWNFIFLPVSSRNEVNRHDIFNLLNLKKPDEKNIFDTVVQDEKKSSGIDQIFYEFVLPKHSQKEYPSLYFHSASLLKSGNMGKTKFKKIKYKEIHKINHKEDYQIIESLLPGTYTSHVFSRYQETGDSFNSAELLPELSIHLLEILKTRRLFIQNFPGNENSEHFTFLKVELNKTIELKIIINSDLKEISLGLFYAGERITQTADSFIFTRINIIYLDFKFYRLKNYLTKDFINQIGINGGISLDENQFHLLRDEILKSIDHRSIAGDCFHLKEKIIDVPYIIHLKLPLTDNFFWACLKQDNRQLNPPFEYLTIYKDEKSDLYTDFIEKKLEQNIDSNGLFQIPVEHFQSFLESCGSMGLKVIADKAVVKPFSQFNMSIVHNLNWFEVSGNFSYDGIDLKLPDLLKNLKKDEQFIELKNGEKVYLPSKWLKKVIKLNEVGEFVDGKYVIHQSRALQLEELELENIELTNFIHKIKDFKSLPDIKVMKEFNGKLREYQSFGLKWMKFLREIGLGGCLADDMGLGKTVQVAANLQIRKKEMGHDRRPSLIVCPKSLIFNWNNELKKFTPNLKVEIIDSGKINLSKLIQGSKTDIFITTYGILQRNCEEFVQNEFDYIVLDEAQAIKNPRSLTAKASFTLKARHRLVLTGTPVENHVGELYSLFNFLMPGIYKKAALNPDHSNRSMTHALKPFILRRTKSQVLTDLPDKVEQIIMCDQSKEEKIHYQKLKDFISTTLNRDIEIDDFKKSSIMVLEALTRLRQAACHPALINPEYIDTESGKLSQLDEMLKEILDEGHKVIIFSQFTTLLKLTRSKLGFNEKNSCYLDGSTQKREEVVKDFQESVDKNVFFISLKAGGTGLNLTEASYCFLLDPWWNPAVEAQAIGRLHRMGQKKSVNIYRLISKDTIEEKVLELQSIKSEIIKDVISDEGDGFIRNLSSKDLQFLLS